MPRKARIWNYFTIVDEQAKKAECDNCSKVLSYKSTVSNLKIHLRQKHTSIFEKICRDQTDNEIIVEEICRGNSDNEFYVEEVCRDIRNESNPKKEHNTRSGNSGAKEKGKRLIEQLTEEKISVATMQKELIAQELEEKKIKLEMLRQEMEHKKYLHAREKQAMEQKAVMSDLAKQEMLLKIEVLQANLQNIRIVTTT